MTLREELASLLQMFHGPSFVGDARPIDSQLLGRHPPRAEFGVGRPWGMEALRAARPTPGPAPAEALGLGRTGAAARGCSGAGPRAGRCRPGEARYRRSGRRSGGEPTPPSGSVTAAVPMATADGRAGPAMSRPCGLVLLRRGPFSAWPCGRLIVTIVTLPRAAAALGVFPGCLRRAAAGASAPSCTPHPLSAEP